MIEAPLRKASRSKRKSRCDRPGRRAARLALTTIAIAFQRMKLLMRRSISRSPGYSGCSERGIVFT